MITSKNTSFRHGSLRLSIKYFFILFLFSSLLFSGCGGSDEEDPTPNTPGSSDDVTPPQITSIDPEDGASDVPINVAIDLTFSEPLDINTIKTGSVVLSGGAFSNLAWNFTMTGSNATLTPDNELQYGTEYTVRLTTEVADLAGNKLTQSFSSSFTTEAAPDNTPPTVQSITPADNASDVSLGSSITIVFSESIDISSVDDITVRNNETSSNIAFTMDVNGEQIIIDPSSDLNPNTEYAISIPTSLKDMAGNNLQSEFNSTFNTENVSVNVSDATINDGQSDVDISTNIVVYFDQSINAASVNADNFYINKYAVGGASTSKINGTISVSGNQITFIPKDNSNFEIPLTEFATDYDLVIGQGIESVSGNFTETTKTISFTTESISTDYYYKIESRGAFGFPMRYRISENEIKLEPIVASYQNEISWYFVYINDGKYAIGNKEAGVNKYIERAVADDGNKVLITGIPGGGGFYGGQGFRLKKYVNTGSFPGEVNFFLTSPDEQTVLEYGLDMTSTTSANVVRLWRLTRLGKK